MANTSTHPITVNGVRLDTWAYNIKVKDGWTTIPDYRGDDITVPGEHGEIWMPNKRRGPGSMVLSMWISSQDVNGGVVGTDPYYNWRKNLDTILKLFNSPYALLDVQQTLTPGTIRQAYCSVAGISDPAMRNDYYGELKIVLSIPGAFWQDTADIDFNFGPSAGVITTHSLTQFLDATAPMEDVIVVVDGPLTNARLTDIGSGHYVQLNMALIAGDQWNLNTTTWSSKTGAGIAFTTGGTSRTSLTQAVGPMLPKLFGIAPGSPPSVQLTGTGATAATRLRIRTRRQYL